MARRQLVPRPRLTGRLTGPDPVERPRLVLVCAPAGFGKTTLLGQWAGGPEQALAWLSLDPDDDDLPRFLTHLVAAVRQAAPQVGADAEALLAAAPGTSAEAVVASLVADLDADPAPLTVALDDFHVIEAAPVHDAVTLLLGSLPPHVTLAIATRADPSLPLARLRARGELLEVRAADLRFTTAEATAFLADVMRLDLTAEQVGALAARTEGWAVGLQLAALTARDLLSRGEPVAGFVDDFAGSTRFVLDYLVEEVLSAQPDDVRDFLLTTSVLDRLTGPLCDALTGRDDSRAVLEHLERANLFVVPLDDRREWHRYHHLFADALRSLLAHRDPARVAGLHRSAARWYAEHAHLPEALGHAVAGDDGELGADVYERLLPDLRRDRADRSLRRWLRALPEDVVRSRPGLAVTMGFVHLSEGDLGGVGPWLDAAEAGAAGLPEEARAEMLATVEIYRASMAQARGDVAGTLDHAREALRLAGDDHRVRSAADGFLGLAAWAAGDLTTAVGTFGSAVRTMRAGGDVADAVGGTVVLADLWTALGRADEARRLCEEVLAGAAHAAPALSTTADVHVALADALREQGDLEDADAHLRTAADLGDAASLPENRHRWYAVSAALARARGDLDGALELLGEAQALYLPGYFPDVRPLAGVRARVLVAAGRLPEARAWAQDRGVRLDGETPGFAAEHDHLTLARLVVAQAVADGDAADRVPPVLDLLDRVIAAAREVDRDGSVLDALLVRALAHHALGEEPAALADLDEALVLARRGGHVRSVLDEGAPMLELLRAVVARPARAGAVTAYARGLLERVEAPRPARAGLVEELSPRELEVLRLLATDLTGPEIARHLFVSVNTLRTHTKRIFTKFDVTNRIAAVRRGVALGLIGDGITTPDHIIG